MDDSDNEIFWGPVTKQEMEVVKKTLPKIPVRPRAVLQSPDVSKSNNNVCINENVNSQLAKKNVSVVSDEEEFHASNANGFVCEVIDVEGYLSVPENDCSSGHSVKNTQGCAENQANAVSNLTSEGGFPEYKINEAGSPDSVEIIYLDSPVEKSDVCISDTTEMCKLSTSRKLLEKSNDSLQESVESNSSDLIKQDSDIAVVYDKSLFSEFSTTFGSVAEDVHSVGNEAYVTCHTTVGELAHQYSSLSINSDSFMKDSIGSNEAEQIKATDAPVISDKVDITTKDDGLYSSYSTYSSSQDTSTCTPSTVSCLESSCKRDRTFILSPNTKSSVVCNDSQSCSQSTVMSNIHSEIKYVERGECLSAECAVVDLAKSNVASPIPTESCSANKSELSSDSRDTNNSALSSTRLNLLKRSSKKDLRYSTYEREKFFGKVRNEMGIEIEKETDSVLWNSSDDSSNSCDLNNTLEEMDMMMKHGLQYMCSKDDSNLGHLSADELYVCHATELQGPMHSEGKRIPFGSKLHCIQSQVQEKCFNGTELKNIVAKDDGGNQFRHHVMKVSKNVGAGVFKTPAKKKPNNFLSIKSPVAEYIKRHPVPLVVKVKSANSKCNGRNENVPLRKLTSNCHVSPTQNTPVRNMTPLPIIKYESAPVLNMVQTKCGEVCVSSKSTSDTPKVIKHTGRAVLGTASSNKLQVMKQSEVSMIFDKSVSQTNTL